MFYTTVLDTAIGLVFTFLAVSLAAGALTEALASMFKWRSTTLLAGVKALLNDKDFTGLALQVYNHALVSPRSDGSTPAGGKPALPPAYIDPQHFAAALADVLKISGRTQGAVENAIKGVRDSGNTQIADLLQGIYHRAGNDLTSFERGLAQWFDTGMDRVSGAYKRRTQAVAFWVGLAIAIGLNVSAIRVALALWDQPLLARAVATTVPASGSATPNVIDVVRDLQALNLPIGWIPDNGSAGEVSRDNIFSISPPGLGEDPGWWFTSVLGWLITAGATLFGAPFWYDTLQHFVRLKGSGPSPEEKAQKKGAAA
jgi:hypothetical protein